MKRVLAVAVLVILALGLGAAPALAQSGRASFGENIVIRADEVVNGDVVSFGGNVTIEKGGQVSGNVVAFGGEVVNDGRVEKDLVVFGGDVTLGDGSFVGGQVAHLGGNVTQSESAVVTKGITGGSMVPVGRLFDWGIGPSDSGQRVNLRAFGGGDLAGKVGSTIFMALLALALALLLPRSLRVAQGPIVSRPWVCLGVGFLTLIVGALLGVVLIVTICLAPTGGLLWLGILAAALLGWVALGHVVGAAILRALSPREYTMPVAAIVGVVVLNLMTLLPIIGGLFGLAVTSVGLGAEVLTLFGSRPFIATRPAPAALVVPPSNPPEAPMAA